SRVMKACVHFTGHLSDADLVLLYSTAVAAAMPSYSEGFGLPAIEAMACGTPVLASSEGSLPEVVGEAGVYFDPFDTRAIADAIIEMVNNKDKREALGLKSVARARDFTWERAAGLALDHLENMYRD
ncbi:MAG: glycosyltransferase, partial [Halioglobus sp.]|nr:glycosyltransferase [Halioglobus sp.]